MKTKFRRGLSILLVVMMLVSSLSMITVLADTPTSSAGQIVPDTGGITYWAATGEKITTGNPSVGDGNAVVSASKTIAPTNTENEFDITLEVKTTVDIEEVQPSADLATVLVIDVSTSMTYCQCKNSTPSGSHSGGCTGESRMKVSKDAALAFINNYVEGHNGAARYVSIVTFGTNANLNTDWIDISIPANKTTVEEAITALSAPSNNSTFIQGGLTLARNLFNDTNAPEVGGETIPNRYVVLLTDGNPTKYYSGADHTSLGQFDSNTGTGNENVSSDNYTTSNVALSRPGAAAVAAQIKNAAAGYNSAKLYTVALSVSALAHGVGDGVSGNNVNAATWLKNYVATYAQPTAHQYAYSVTNYAALLEAFRLISENIRRMTTAWEVTDPMGAFIDYVSGTGEGVSYVATGETLTWKIHQMSAPTRTEGANGEINVFTFTYRVKLDTLKAGFTEGEEYAANGTTTLSYFMGVEPGEVPDADDLKEASFLVPQVKGYLGDLSFYKVGGNESGAKLAGFEFALKDSNGNVVKTATSNAAGLVEFEDIPSGHSYTIVETKIPDSYKDTYKFPDNNIVAVTVAYGEVTSALSIGHPFVNPLIVQSARIPFTKTVNSAAYAAGTTVTITATWGTSGSTSETITLSGRITTGAISLTAAQVAEIVGSGESGTVTVTETAVAHGTGDMDVDWVRGTETYTVTVYKNGEVKRDGVLVNANAPLAFNNTFTKHYTVTVNYYVDGIGKIDSMTVVLPTNYLINDPYDASGYVHATISHSGNEYNFYQAATSDTGKTPASATSLDGAKTLAAGTIPGNVVIDLHYMTLPSPTVSLKKEIALVGEAYPTDYNFRFVLTDSASADGTVYTNPLPFSKTEIDAGTSKDFVFIVGMAALANKTLYLHETTESGWTNVTGTPYVTFDNRLVMRLLTQSTTITNTYTQTIPGSVRIELAKLFDLASVEGSNLIDGATYDCKHDSATCGEDPCTHVCGDDCYTYSFTFAVDEVTGSAQTVEFTVAQIKGDAAYANIFFTIPDTVYNKDGGATVTIRETSTNPAWNNGTALTPTTVTISKYGTVSYADSKATAELTNVFNGKNPPSIELTKNFASARNASDKLSGTFYFELKNGGTVIDTITVNVTTNGTQTVTVDLSAYTYSGAVLTLSEKKEVANFDASNGTMNYDETIYEITITDGVAVITSASSAVFNNTFFENIAPEFSIKKNINRPVPNDATFSFTWSRTADGASDTAVTDQPIGITVDAGTTSNEIAAIQLPENYTGTVTVVETAGVVYAADGYGYEWINDTNTTRTIKFVNGVLVVDSSSSTNVAEFLNGYYAPDVELVKNATTAGNIIINVTEVDYTLYVRNIGNEALDNIVVTDEFFVSNAKADFVAGSLAVATKETGSAGAATDVSATNYDFTAGVLTFDASYRLAIGHELIITYKAIPKVSGKIVNEAEVDALGVGKGDPVDGEDDAEVEVKTGNQVDPIVLNVKKYVAEGDYRLVLIEDEDYNDIGITVPDRTVVTFKIVVSAQGGTHSDPRITINLSDVIGEFDGTVVIDEEPVALGSDASFTLSKNTDNSYGPKEIYVSMLMRNTTTENVTFKNVATATSDVTNTDDDDADVEVGPYIPGLDVVKTVKEYVGGATPTASDIEDIIAKSVNFNSSGRKGIFKVTIKNTGTFEITLQNIVDNYAGTGIDKVYIAKEYDGVVSLTEIDLADLYTDPDYNTLAPNASLTFYYITDAIRVTGTYVNNVTVTAIDSKDPDAEPLTDSDSASIIVSWGGGFTPEDPKPTPPIPETPETPNNPAPQDEPAEEFVDEIPMGAFEPEEEFIDQLPLGALETGDDNALVIFATLLLISVLGIVALCLTTKKKSNVK